MSESNDPRPRPEYGEYAPEGWEWKPESDEQEPSGQEPDGARPADGRDSGDSRPATGYGDRAAVPSPHASSGVSSSAGPVAGVPHNLGVKGAANQLPQAAAPAARTTPTGTTPSSTPSSSASPSNGAVAPGSADSAGHHAQSSGADRGGDPAPYRADAPQPLAPSQARAMQAAQASAAGVPAQNDRRGDRIITIILLVIGGFGALYNALSLMQLPASMELILTALGSDASVPAWIGTMSTISAIGTLALYAVTLIYSVQRVRARKLTFFVPLIAGVVAIVVVIAVSIVAMLGIPGFADLMQDPDAAGRMMESLLQTSQ
ncbi:DUF6264 family protein [Leucobacter sp. GX24907]